MNGIRTKSIAVNTLTVLGADALNRLKGGPELLLSGGMANETAASCLTR